MTYSTCPSDCAATNHPGSEHGAPVIPAEAVEAAANLPGAAILAAESAVFDAMIEHGPDGRTDGHDKLARAALEAAAPYIQAAAWEQGAAADHDWDGEVTVPNPYRPAL